MGLLIAILSSLVGCAIVHHVQLGEIDGRTDSVRFEVKVSETGVDLVQAAEIGRRLSAGSNSKELRQLRNLIALFQLGPRTGYPVYTDSYAQNLIDMIHKSCPSGRISGLTSIREMRRYPVVSGEIVKIVGYCHTTNQI